MDTKQIPLDLDDVRKEIVRAFPLRFVKPYGEDTCRAIWQSALELLEKNVNGGFLGFYMKPNFPLCFISDKILAILGYSYDAFMEATGGLVLNCIHPRDRAFMQKSIDACREKNISCDLQLRLARREGGVIWVRYVNIVHALPDGDSIMIGVCFDITDEKKLQYELDLSAEYDPLTGAFNYSRFKLEAAKALEENHDVRYSFWFCDVKNFKFINNIYGHDVGDHILQFLAKIIEDEVRPGECCARVSSDHFSVLRRYNHRNELQSYFDKLSGMLADYDEGLMDKKFPVELVCGVYCIESRPDILSIDDMFDRANLAQKTVKHTGGSRMAFYSESMLNKVIREKEIESQMQVALAMNEFCVYLQPQVDIQNGDRIIGAEALVRWNREGAGMIMPGDFIPLFEKNGFIVDLDRYVFIEICRYLSECVRWDKPLYKISVNVSRISVFQSDFASTYIKIKNEFRVPDGLLELECTETTLVENSALLGDIIRQVQENGFLFSLDDFGSGYSSLNCLKDVAVDVLKLDMAFFRRELNNNRDRAIAQSVITMAKLLDMKTVAEGVETQRLLGILREMGCDIVQGYLFGRPMPIPDFEAMYDRWSSHARGQR